MKQDDSIFEIQPRVGKWSTGQNVQHLISSGEPVLRALNTSKEKLRARFGTVETENRTYNEFVEEYQKVLRNGAKAMGPFVPTEINNSEKVPLINHLRQLGGRLADSIALWSQDELNSQALPHPVLGNLSMHEMVLFTILHTNHHFATIRSLNIEGNVVK